MTDVKHLPGVVILVILAVGVVHAQTLERRPYIQDLRSDSVVVMWQTDAPASTHVEIRKSDDSNWTDYSCSIPVTRHEMRIPGLEPNTGYEYRVSGGKRASASSTPTLFQTFPSGPIPEFQFVAYGDHRNNPEAHRSVVEAVLRKAQERGLPRFVVDTGDFTGDGENKTDFWDEQFFDPERDLMDRVCLFPVIGNHEAPGRLPRIPFRYLENFAVPTDRSGTEYYYSFNFGDAHLCMIDIWSSAFEKGTKQYAWIEQDLKKSDKRWKFAVMHFPIYVYRSAPSVTYGNEAVREHLVPLFQKYGVTMIFSGDSHFYQRSDVEGIQYVCTGGAGAPLYTPGEAPYVRASAKSYHYVWIQIAGETLTLEAFDSENRQLDSVTVGPREPQLPKPPSLNFVRRLPDESMRPAESIVVESRDAGGNVTPGPEVVESGSWLNSTVKSTAPGLVGQGSRFSDNQEGDATVRIVPPIREPGLYLVSITTPGAGSVNAPNTLFTVGPASESVRSPDAHESVTKIEKSSGLIRGRVSLTAEVTGNRWLDLGLFAWKPGDALSLVEAEDEPGRFYFDAVRFTRYVKGEGELK